MSKVSDKTFTPAGAESIASKMKRALPKVQASIKAVEAAAEASAGLGEVINNLPPVPVEDEAELRKRFVELAKGGNNWILGELAHRIAGAIPAAYKTLDREAKLSDGHTYKLAQTYKAFRDPTTRNPNLPWTTHNHVREAVASVAERNDRLRKGGADVPAYLTTAVDALKLIGIVRNREEIFEAVMDKTAPKLATLLATKRDQARAEAADKVSVSFRQDGDGNIVVVADEVPPDGFARIGRAKIPAGRYTLTWKSAVLTADQKKLSKRQQRQLDRVKRERADIAYKLFSELRKHEIVLKGEEEDDMGENAAFTREGKIEGSVELVRKYLDGDASIDATVAAILLAAARGDSDKEVQS